MFKVVYKFMDLQDNNTVYEVGDAYPRDGYHPSDERVAELLGEDNKIGKSLIEDFSISRKKAKTRSKKNA